MPVPAPMSSTTESDLTARRKASEYASMRTLSAIIKPYLETLYIRSRTFCRDMASENRGSIKPADNRASHAISHRRYFVPNVGAKSYQQSLLADQRQSAIFP